MSVLIRLGKSELPKNGKTEDLNLNLDRRKIWKRKLFSRVRFIFYRPLSARKYTVVYIRNNLVLEFGLGRTKGRSNPREVEIPYGN